MIDLSIITTWMENNLMGIIFKFVQIIIVWIIVYLFTKKFDKFIAKKFSKGLKFLNIGKRRFKLLDDIMDICVNILGVIITLYLLELTSVIYTILTAAGVMGIVIGFAVKEIASNYISGLIIRFTQPFIKGDYIKLNENVSGTVLKLTPFNTEILSYEGILTIVPNFTLISKSVINYSREPNRLINIKVSISKDNDVDIALKVLKQIGKKEKERIKNKEVSVFVDNIDEYKINLTLRFWTPKPVFWNIKRNTLKMITKEFKKNNIELAVPLRKSI
jgi:small-conductance mechanosensitive channel